MNNNFEREILKKLLQNTSYAVYKSSLIEMQRTEFEKLTEEMFPGTRMSRYELELEHHPSIQTNVTDKDMLLVHIDMALDEGDSELFQLLTDELKAMEVSV